MDFELSEDQRAVRDAFARFLGLLEAESASLIKGDVEELVRLARIKSEQVERAELLAENDRAVADGKLPATFEHMLLVAAFLPLMGLVRSVGQFLGDYFVQWVGNRVVMDLRTRTFALDLSKYDGLQLRVKADGRIMNGNTRVKVLEERGYNLDSLPREVI